MCNDDIKTVSAINPSVFCNTKYSLTSIPSVDAENCTLLLCGNNRIIAEEDIMQLSDILHIAHEYDERIPDCRIYSDDIRFDYSSALSPDLYTHLTYCKYDSKHYALILHYYITLSDNDCIFGDITYGEGGEISRYTAVFEHKKDVIFIDCAFDGSSLVIERADFLEGKRKKRRYPFIMVDSRAIRILTATIIMALAIIAAIVYFISYCDNITKNTLIISPETTQSETAPYEFLPSGSKETDKKDSETVFEGNGSLNDIQNTSNNQPKYNNLSLVEFTETVSAGDKANISVKGKPHAVYSIEVNYSSGKSSASGLESKMSNGDGIVSWSWTVGSRTAAGKYSVVIKSESVSYIFYFEVVE